MNNVRNGTVTYNETSRVRNGKVSEITKDTFLLKKCFSLMHIIRFLPYVLDRLISH